MFKSLQWKLVLIFVLIILSVLIVAGTFLLNSVMVFYHEQFVTQITDEFSGGLKKDLEDAAVSFDPVSRINAVMDEYSGKLSISKNRNFYVLDEDANLLIRSDLDTQNIENTENLISAINGKEGSKTAVDLPYMDYGYPVKVDGKIKYIIYIKDNKRELLNVAQSIFEIILQAVLFGVLIAVIIAFFLSKTITKPIRHLTYKAKRMSEGQFETQIAVISNDEIGDLTNTFNVMATRLKETMEDIQNEKSKVDVVLKYMADGILAFDTKGEVIHINPAAYKMLSLNKNTKYNFKSLSEKMGIDIKLQKAVNLRAKKPMQWQVAHKNSVYKAHFAPFKGETDRKVGGIVVVLSDITEQQKLDMSRRAFVADVSHELRTPLTNIKSYAETLLDGAIEDKNLAYDFLNVIDNEASRMARLVTDLLSLSKLDHKQKLEKENVDIEELIQRVVKKMSIEIKAHNHTLTFVEGTPPPPIMVNQDKIEQVIVNIVSNAIKYTPDGGSITIICGQQENMVYIKISDTGIGIPKEDIALIFDRFYRVDKARSREKGGTGLGLAIAREIVEAHGGNISIESELEKGSVVTIRLPINVSQN